MAKNDYLDRQHRRDQKFLDVGEEMGMQKMWDYVQIALRDPEVVGRFAWGRKRLRRLYYKCSELASHYHNAFTDEVDADKLQSDLDKSLKEVWVEELSTFYERYPWLKKQKYDKPKKGWV